MKRSKKYSIYILAIVSLFFILLHCSDKTKKLLIYDGDVRIEYSRCTGLSYSYHFQDNTVIPEVNAHSCGIDVFF